MFLFTHWPQANYLSILNQVTMLRNVTMNAAISPYYSVAEDSLQIYTRGGGGLL